MQALECVRKGGLSIALLKGQPTVEPGRATGQAERAPGRIG
jgi:hypothetical protein